jgi:hypothetical protein
MTGGFPRHARSRDRFPDRAASVRCVVFFERLVFVLGISDRSTRCLPRKDCGLSTHGRGVKPSRLAMFGDGRLFCEWPPEKMSA